MLLVEHQASLDNTVVNFEMNYFFSIPLSFGKGEEEILTEYM